jgi:hypothetical protein
LISQNLNEQDLGVKVEPLTIDIDVPIASPKNATPMEVARAFEQADFRRQVVDAVKGHSALTDRLPAVLGLSQHRAVLADLESNGANLA